MSKSLYKILNTIYNFVILLVPDFKLLKLLWNECEVPIYRTLQKEMGAANWFIPTGDGVSIEIGTMSNIKKITTLLHEIGHIKDAKRYGKTFSNWSVERAEKSAWKHAIRLSRKYNLPIDVEFSIKCLKSYETEYAVLNNMKKRGK
jgi:hypothetical protein